MLARASAGCTMPAKSRPSCAAVCPGARPSPAPRAWSVPPASSLRSTENAISSSRRSCTRRTPTAPSTMSLRSRIRPPRAPREPEVGPMPSPRAEPSRPSRPQHDPLCPRRLLTKAHERLDERGNRNCSGCPKPATLGNFYTKIHQRLLRPLIDAPDQPPAPVGLRRALHTIARTIDECIDHARLGTAA
jgi:hypothetical protein